MFGFRYLKARPTQFVLQYRNGQIRRQGTGLSFWYYAPVTTIAIVPVGSVDVSFIFNEITADFQQITVQGQLTYRIIDPELVASLLDYSVSGPGGMYLSDDPENLSQRIVNLAQLYTKTEVQSQEMQQVIRRANEIAETVSRNIAQSDAPEQLGVEVLIYVITMIQPIPEVSRALEADAREELMRRMDDAVYERRNSAVDQERRIKENELNTSILVKEKQRQIQETELAGQIELEMERKRLVEAKVENARAEADVEAYAVAASLEPLKSLSPELLETLAYQTADPRLMTALALRQIAENAEKIGQLYITPELLDGLMERHNGNVS